MSNPGLRSKRVDTATRPTPAWNSYHCANTEGRPTFDSHRRTCVDPAGSNGYDNFVPGTPDDWDYTQAFVNMRQTDDAAQSCGVWTSPWGTQHPPLLTTEIVGGPKCGRTGYHVCDSQTNQCVKGSSGRNDMESRDRCDWKAKGEYECPNKNYERADPVKVETVVTAAGVGSALALLMLL